MHIDPSSKVRHYYSNICSSLQCFVTAGWATGRASGVKLCAG